MLSCSRRDSREISSGPEVAANDVAAERQRQAVGALGPPLAEVDELPQALLLVGELAFVNQQPRLDLAVAHGLEDLVKRHHDVLHVGLVEPQREKRGRQRARNRHRDAVERGRSVACARPPSGRSCRPCWRRAAAGCTCPSGARRRGTTPPRSRTCPRRPRDSASRCPTGRARARGRRVGHLAAGKAVEHERVVGIRTVSDVNLHRDQGRSGFTGWIRFRSRGAGLQPASSRGRSAATGGRRRRPCRRCSRLLLPWCSGPRPKRIEARARSGSRPSAFKHVGRLLAARRARRSGRHADVVDADAAATRRRRPGKLTFRLLRQAMLERAVDVQIGHARAQALEQPVAQRREPLATRSSAPPWQSRAALPKPTMPGTFSVPDRSPRS